MVTDNFMINVIDCLPAKLAVAIPALSMNEDMCTGSAGNLLFDHKLGAVQMKLRISLLR